MTIPIHILFFILAGLVLGSFATMLIYRTALGISWGLSARSACPQCRTVLKPRDLVPFFSWLLLKGRCRACGWTIPVHYPLVELGMVCASLGVYAAYGFSTGAFFLLALLPFLAALLVIDLQTLTLPDKLIVAAGVTGVMRLLVEGFVVKSIDPALIGINYVLGAFLYGGLAWLLRRVMSAVLKKDVMGIGDIKFFAVAGLWLGLSTLAMFCMASGVLGIVFAIYWQVVKKQRIFPFGPALIASLYVLLLVQGSLLI